MTRAKVRVTSAALLLALQIPFLLAQSPNRIAVVGGMLLDGYEVPPVHNAVVLIEGNRIAAVGRVGEIAVPADAKVIDAGGSTVLPGLIDLHVHLTILGHGDYNVWDARYQDRMEEVMTIAAKQLLTAGVTSAVDLGAAVKESAAVRDAIEAGKIPGPRMHMSGPWLIRTSRPIPPQSAYYQTLVDTPEDAARKTAELCEAGMDVIKAYTGLTPAHYRAIVQTARRCGVKVHAHVYRPEDVRNALEAGVDVLQHAGSAGTPPYDADLIQAIAVAGTPVVVTAAHRIWVFPATVEFPERIRDPQLKKDFPADIYRDIQESLRNFHTLDYFAATDRQIFYGPENVRRWIKSGVVMGMGTDSGTPLNFHTEALWRELKVFVDHGMSPLKAISATTRINARILGQESELGTIEVGKLADLIVVRGNPLFDVAFLGNVEHVIKDGVIYK